MLTEFQKKDKLNKKAKKLGYDSAEEMIEKTKSNEISPWLAEVYGTYAVSLFCLLARKKMHEPNRPNHSSAADRGPHNHRGADHFWVHHRDWHANKRQKEKTQRTQETAQRGKVFTQNYGQTEHDPSNNAICVWNAEANGRSVCHSKGQGLIECNLETSSLELKHSSTSANRQHTKT